MAVALVLLDHARVPGLGGGFVGVDVFFVISGFLISGHLAESLRRTGGIDLLGFYSARVRRILPAALVVIVATAIVSLFVVSPLRIVQILQDAVAAALYVPNLLFAVRQTDYLAGTAPSPFQHFWSLGVEEQFYLVWPLLLLVAFSIGRRSPRVLMGVIGAVALLSLVSSATVTADDPSFAFFSPTTRAWEFGVGALIAGGGALLGRVPLGIARALAWAGLAMIGSAAVAFSAESQYPGIAALLPVTGAALVIAFGGRDGGAGAVLRFRPMQFVGAISYSLYLVHWPVLVLVHERAGLGTALPAALGAVLVLACVPLAWLLHRFVETPFRSKRWAAKTTLAGSTAITLALVAALFGGSIAATALPLSSSRTAPAESVAAELPEGTPFVPANISPSLAEATADTGEIYSNGCQQNLRESAVLSCSFGDTTSAGSIALFGDSHAGRWFPALEIAAKGLGYRLDTYTKSGCRSEETVAAWNASANRSCSLWRNDVIDRLNTDPPDVIVLANHLGPQPNRDPVKLERDWTEGLSQLIERLPASSSIVMMADSPEFASSPVLCLSTHLANADDCSVPRVSAFNWSVRAAQLAAASEHGARVIDMTDFFCNASRCPAVVGAGLVYADEHHLTATFSRTLAAPLEQRLAVYLAVR